MISLHGPLFTPGTEERKAMLQKWIDEWEGKYAPEKGLYFQVRRWQRELDGEKRWWEEEKSHRGESKAEREAAKRAKDREKLEKWTEAGLPF